MTKLYIAGPMSGYPDYNRPAFHLAELALRGQGFDVVNPATTPEPCAEPEWRCWTRASIARMLAHDVTGVALLPGWAVSAGATLEHSIASALGLPALALELWVREGAGTRRVH